MKDFYTDLQATRQFLKNNSDFLVVKADKANSTVIVEKLVYHDKMIELLGEPKNYKLLQADPTDRIEKESNEFVKNVHSNG